MTLIWGAGRPMAYETTMDATAILGPEAKEFDSDGMIVARLIDGVYSYQIDQPFPYGPFKITACSSRSATRRAGTCGLKPSRCINRVAPETL